MKKKGKLEKIACGEPRGLFGSRVRDEEQIHKTWVGFPDDQGTSGCPHEEGKKNLT